MQRKARRIYFQPENLNTARYIFMNISEELRFTTSMIILRTNKRVHEEGLSKTFPSLIKKIKDREENEDCKLICIRGTILM